jgi:hypothetical protein
MFTTLKRNLSTLLILALFGALLAACNPLATPAPTPAEAEVEAEEQAVYVAVFEELFGEPQMYVLMSETSPGIEGEEGLDSILEYILPQMTGLDEETATSFQVRNEAAYPLRPDMDLGLPYVLLTRDEANQIFAVNTDGWDVFYSRYPNSPGMTTVSRVGFNADFTQALVYVGTQSHWLAGAGYYLLLEKSFGTWQVEQQVMAWIS